MVYDYKVPNVGDKIYIRQMDEFLKTTDETCETVKDVIITDTDGRVVEFESGLKIYWNNIFLNNLTAVVSKKQHVLENIIPYYCTCPDYMSYGYDLENIDKAVELYKNGIITRLDDEIRKMKKKIKTLQKKVDKKQEFINKIND